MGGKRGAIVMLASAGVSAAGCAAIAGLGNYGQEADATVDASAADEGQDVQRVDVTVEAAPDGGTEALADATRDALDALAETTPDAPADAPPDEADAPGACAPDRAHCDANATCCNDCQSGTRVCGACASTSGHACIMQDQCCLGLYCAMAMSQCLPCIQPGQGPCFGVDYKCCSQKCLANGSCQ